MANNPYRVIRSGMCVCVVCGVGGVWVVGVSDCGRVGVRGARVGGGVVVVWEEGAGGVRVGWVGRGARRSGGFGLGAVRGGGSAEGGVRGRLRRGGVR